MIEEPNEKFKLFESIKQKHPTATNAYLNYLLKGISLEINSSITDTILKLRSNPKFFMSYYEKRAVDNNHSFWRAMYNEIKEWRQIRKLSKTKLNAN